MNDTVKLKMALPRIPEIELVALEGLERLARHLGISGEKIGEARILVTEALTNALEHAGDRHPLVRVEFTMTPKELTIFVRDYGEGFEPSAVQDPEAAAGTGSIKKRGWGLKLMRSLSDGFHIQSGKTGTRITITKRLR
jgi:anti-sigma regulatory factor (Ser/Thr protein kinase)